MRLKESSTSILMRAIYPERVDAMLMNICSLGDKRMAAILLLRLGIYGERPWTLEEIAKLFKVTRERVRQLESKGCRMMHMTKRYEHEYWTYGITSDSIGVLEGLQRRNERIRAAFQGCREKNRELRATRCPILWKYRKEAVDFQFWKAFLAMHPKRETASEKTGTT